MEFKFFFEKITSQENPLFLSSFKYIDEAQIEIEVDIGVLDKKDDKKRSYSPEDYSDKYRITFEGFVSFNIFNESFMTKYLDESKKEGERNLFEFSKSKYRDYVQSVVYCEKTKLKHISVLCFGEVIEVITEFDPTIEVLRTTVT